MISYNSTASGSKNKAPKNKRPSSFLFDDEIDVSELGAETEAEQQMKVLLQKQLDTNLSLKDQFSRHRSFCCPSTYNSLTELVEGTCTLEHFKEIEKNEELHQELQRCGLTEEEITDYFSFKSGKCRGKYSVDPSILSRRIEEIERKIKAHKEDLVKPQAFKNVKRLTKHEYEIEKSLYAGVSNKTKLAPLVAVVEDEDVKEVKDAFDHVKSLANQLLAKKRKKTQDIKSQFLSKAIEFNSEDSFKFDANIHHATVLLDEKEVSDNRLSIKEIRSIPKFENYQTGEPNLTLYLKNLHPKVTVSELHSLFDCFEVENKVPVQYNICKGRMKGQAFVSFADVKVAEKALLHSNGFMLRGKPIIIEFGKKKINH